MNIKPLSLLRWIAALAVLAFMLGILVSRSPSPDESDTARPASSSPFSNPRQQAPDTPAAEPAVTAETEEPLPALDSLNSLNLDKAPARRNLDLQHWSTDQGARVYFMQADELPMLDVQILFAAGASRDGELAGLATLTNGMLNEGIDGKDASAIAAGFERLGAQFSNGSHRDMAQVSLRSLTAADKLDPALELFTEVLTRPSFPEDAYQRLRDQLLASLRLRLQRPASLASEAFWADLYPGHPYGSLPEGQPETLAQINTDSLRDFHQRFYTSGNAVISLVGAIDREQAERIAQRLSDAMPQGPAAEPIANPAPIAPGHRHIEFNGQQTHILLGQHGITRHDPDYVALYVGNQILGGSGFGSRLMEEIRETRGLAYSVSSYLAPMQATGPFRISMQTRADQASLALEVLHDSLDRFIAEGPTEAELISSKRQIMGQFPLSTASNESIVGQLGVIGFYGLPLNHLQLFLDQVQALSVQDIRDAFSRHFQPDQRLVITVGPPLDSISPATPASAEQDQGPDA